MRGGPDATGVWGYRTALRSQKRGAADAGEARAARGPRLRSPSQHGSKAVWDSVMCLPFNDAGPFCRIRF
jgi:hypothetical protein